MIIINVKFEKGDRGFWKTRTKLPDIFYRGSSKNLLVMAESGSRLKCWMRKLNTLMVNGEQIRPKLMKEFENYNYYQAYLGPQIFNKIVTYDPKSKPKKVSKPKTKSRTELREEAIKRYDKEKKIKDKKEKEIAARSSVVDLKASFVECGLALDHMDRLVLAHASFDTVFGLLETSVGLGKLFFMDFNLSKKLLAKRVSICGVVTDYVVNTHIVNRGKKQNQVRFGKSSALEKAVPEIRAARRKKVNRKLDYDTYYRVMGEMGRKNFYKKQNEMGTTKFLKSIGIKNVGYYL